jgi:hypothetical protein
MLSLRKNARTCNFRMIALDAAMRWISFSRDWGNGRTMIPTGRIL